MPDLTEEYFLNNFNTQLNPKEEQKFQSWAKQYSKKVGRDVTQDAYDYDIKGAWKSGAFKSADERGHFTDQFKKPNHPTFSDQSIYHNTPSEFGFNWEGGRWSPNGQGWAYYASPTMMNVTHNPYTLFEYMQKYEPGVQLVIPTNPEIVGNFG